MSCCQICHRQFITLVSAYKNSVWNSFQRTVFGRQHTLTVLFRYEYQFLCYSNFSLYLYVYFVPSDEIDNNNKYTGLTRSWNKIHAARVSRDSSSYRPISAARARPQQQTRRSPLLLSNGTDRQTDGRTHAQPFFDAYRVLRGPHNDKA